MKTMCPYCEDMREIKIIKKNEESIIRSRKIESEAEYSLCTICNKEFATFEQMDITLRNSYNVFRTLENIIFPDEIIRIREKYNVSQKAFAKILDLGELTINSFEQGALPSKSVSNLINLMGKLENFTDLFEKNKSKLSDHQIKKIESALSEQIIHCYNSDPDIMVGVKEKYTGYRRADWEKVIAVMQLILFYSGKSIYKMVLLKILFYIDFTSYKYNVCSITGWPYARLPYGPVPEDWKTIIRIAEENNALSFEPDEFETGDLFRLPDSFDIDKMKLLFTSGQFDLIKRITLKLKDKTATELKDLTHKEDAWLKTGHAEKIDYKHADVLKLF